MWAQKFGFVVGKSLTFPFKHFSEISRFFSKVVLILSLFILLISMGGQLTTLPESRDIGIQSIMGLGLLLGALFIFMTFLAYLVGILRVVVTGDLESSIFSMIFTRRYYLCLWANIKIVLASLPILIIVSIGTFLLVKLIYPVEFIGKEGISFATDTFLSQEEIQRVKFGAMLMRASWGVIFLTIISRWYFAIATAALDKSTSLRNAWVLTRGNWWLIALSLAFVCIISGTIGWLVWTAIISMLSPLINTLSLSMMAPIVAIIYAFIILFCISPVFATYGYLYLILTNQIKFGAPS